MDLIFFVGILMIVFPNAFVNGGEDRPKVFEITEDDVELFQKKATILIEADQYLKKLEYIRDPPSADEDEDWDKPIDERPPESKRPDPRNKRIIFSSAEDVPEVIRKLYLIMHARYLHFWTMLSYFTCTMVYEKESPEKNETKSRRCSDMGDQMFKFLYKPHYYDIARDVVDHEIGTTFSLRQVSANLQILIQGYADIMHREINLRPSIDFFFRLCQYTKNIRGVEKKPVKVRKTTVPTDAAVALPSAKPPLRSIKPLKNIISFLAELASMEPAGNTAPKVSRTAVAPLPLPGSLLAILAPSEPVPLELYYKETFRRIIKFYGNVLDSVERYFNSALVDDKDFDCSTMVPTFAESKKFWIDSDPRNRPFSVDRTPLELWVMREGAKFRLAAEQAKETIEPGHPVFTNLGDGNQVIALDDIPPFENFISKLDTQPSGASEFLVLLEKIPEKAPEEIAAEIAEETPAE